MNFFTDLNDGTYDNPDILSRLPSDSPDDIDITTYYDDDELQDAHDMIWDLISSIKDPEFDYTLEQLKITKEKFITITKTRNGILDIIVRFKPTVPHCSQAVTIGLCLAHAVMTSIEGIKWRIEIVKGAHMQEKEINKQINDKERILAAMEHEVLKSLVERLLLGPSNNHY